MDGTGAEGTGTLGVRLPRRSLLGALALAAADAAGAGGAAGKGGGKGRRGSGKGRGRGDGGNRGKGPGRGIGDHRGGETAGGPPVALGAFVPGAPRDPAALDAFARLVGRPPAVAMWFQHWGLPATAAFDPALPRAAAARGAAPVITWEPWDPRAGLDQPAYRLAAVARGDFDDYARAWARGLAAYGDPVWLRFAHEMNGTWYPWCVGVNGNAAEDYRAAWVRLRGLFAEEGAGNVRWVWSPNVDFRGASPLGATFPGDDLVDWVALDGYNWGTAAGAGWRSFELVFGASYDALAALSSRPMMLAEAASAEAGGSKARWIDEGLRRTLPVRFPRVRAAVWFHQKKEADWRVDSSRASLKAYRQAAADPALQGTLA